MTLQMQTPVKFIKRIGERIAAGLHERGVETVEDLLYHLPFRYEDRLHPKPLSSYMPGEMASVIGEVRGTVLLRTRSGPIFEMTVGVAPLPAHAVADDPVILSESTKKAVILSEGRSAEKDAVILSEGRSPKKDAVILSEGRSPKSKDPEATRRTPTASAFSTPNPTTNPPEPTMSGLLKPPPVFETIKCLWFHGAYLKDRFRPGQRIALYGKLEGSRSGNALNAPPGSTKFKMVQPTFEILPDATATGESGSPASGARWGEDDAEFTTLEMGRIVPVYPSLGGTTPWGSKLTSRWLRRVMWTIFKDLKSSYDPSVGSASHNDLSSRPDPERAKRVEEGVERPASAAGAPPTTKWACVGSEETLPAALCERLGLPSRMAALEAIHFPAAGTSMTELMSARTPAHRRLIFEELFYLELGLELKRRRLRERAGTSFATNDQVRQALKQVLPFKPTGAQKRVLGEIVEDMRAPRPMRRLLQGDVGSGKTIVALEAALVAIENGYQVAMMAPTEILATQHFLSARKLLRDAISPSRQRPYRVTLLTGSLDDRMKRDARGRIFRGETDLAIGTHALVEEKVDFDNLGLVIVDEQHRFGVQQRFKLMRKPRPKTLSSRPETEGRSGETPVSPASNNDADILGEERSPEKDAVILSEGRSAEKDAVILSEGRSPKSKDPEDPHPANAASAFSATNPKSFVSEPDVLVMTATPIPRTLALTIYGDLEASVLDELPPGRTPIVTRRMPEERADEVWDFVRKQVAQGRQAYIVYPIIEGERDDQPELDFANDASATTDPGAPRFDSETWVSPASAEKPPAKSRTTKRSSSRTVSDASSSRPKAHRAGVERPLYFENVEPASKAAPKRTPHRAKLRSASEMFDDLSNGALHGLKLGLLHGRMSADDKDVTMARFQRGEIDVLISTTVIEVGVDVPNASVMVIEHAERFGLAQMHQLRGRVGRGAAKSYCVLLTGKKISPEAELRLDAMVQTQDGFALAEIDLAQRGPGEFFGTRQAGLPEFRVANLARDRDLLELAKSEAARFVQAPDPAISREERDAVWSRLKRQWQRRYGLVEA